MQQSDTHYPSEPCPFCTIAAAFPYESIASPSPTSLLWNAPVTKKKEGGSGKKKKQEQEQEQGRGQQWPRQDHGDDDDGEEGGQDEIGTDDIPSEEESDCEKTAPSSFVVLRSRYVVAFLDILPMTRGHLLVTTRNHKVKLADMGASESREIGFWLPLLARTVATVTRVTDYNIVQNNGARAAQVVPHVHFHIIPRPESMPRIQNKSWTMFGRGQREDLDEEEGARLASEMRRVLRGVVARDPRARL